MNPRGTITSPARPDRHAYVTPNDESWFVHGGNRADETTGAIRTPIVMANSYALARGSDHHRGSRPPGPRLHPRVRRQPSRPADQTRPPRTRGGSRCVRYRHGGHARRVLHPAQPGDYVIVSNVVYIRVRGLFDALLPAKLSIGVDFVDITDLDAVRAALRPTTRLIHTEAIANPDLRVADVTALADIAHGAGARLSVDSTFTPPPMLRPLHLGADLVLHSLTKYFNGHGDAMGGAVIGPGTSSTRSPPGLCTTSAAASRRSTPGSSCGAPSRCRCVCNGTARTPSPSRPS